MNKYSNKSDFEINKAVAVARGAKPFHDDGFKKSTGHFHKGAVIIKAKFKIGAFDPCNNPADAMPIIIDNKITVAYDYRNCVWVAYFTYEISAHSNNYYRAAMEVFLMMKGA